MRSLIRHGLAALVGLALLPCAALAESALLLPLPETFGDIAADTYDEDGRRLGDASMRVARLPNGHVELEARSGIEGSAGTTLSAVLQNVGEGRGLRLLSQRSESKDEEGRALGVLSIDHAQGTASCKPPGDGAAETVALPADDRVVNVPLNLLFQPLVTGEQSEIEFQILLCRAGARFVKAKASVAKPGKAGGEGLIEVRYNLDVGPLLSRLAAPFLPRLSVWFDRKAEGDWIGHRVPLFAKGPTVLVVRSGISPLALGAGR